TMAQLSKEQKGQISHRRNAINLLEAYLAGDQNV
ncbi:TPA: non-canonical purine NTP pyrophosphatase, partial [Staphylococcus aureus]|nr:non-canonical purine NTP pyrophosphatase [Staphylococcus aureus]